jgi:hypothetical protein
MADMWRDLALFNLAIDNKLRACDFVKLRIDEVCSGAKVRDRATVVQKKDGPISAIEIIEQTRASLEVRALIFECNLSPVVTCAPRPNPDAGSAF